MRRVAVTGMGVLCALGQGREAFVRGLREARCALAPLAAPPAAELAGLPFGAVGGFEAPPDAAKRRASRADRLARAAALEAAADAVLPQALQAEAAVVLGVGAGDLDALERYVHTHDRVGPAHARPADLLAFPPAGSVRAVARALGAKGPGLALMTACSSSATALGHALDLVRTGRVPVAFAGGTEPLSRLTLSGFAALRALSPEPCRPFDAERRGLSLGEGAAMLVLEDAARARARGAHIWAELAGWGASCDGHHMTAPDAEGWGAARAMTAALADAGLAPGDIDYVNAHGTGTPQNDPVETTALHRVFGSHARRLLVSSTKSQIGHTQSAAGAIEAAATVAALALGFAPATATLRTPDPACDLDYVPGQTRPLAARAALSNSFGFGGNNVALAFRAAEALS